MGRRTRIVAWIAAGSVAATAATYIPLTLLSPLDAVAPAIAPYTAPDLPATELAWPGFGASAIGAKGYEGVLAANGSDDALPIASISKIITALVVLDARPLVGSEPGPAITLGPADAALYDSYLRQNGTVVRSQAGFVFSQRQMLEISLIASANNYTESLANWAFGSVPAFAAAADTWLDERGLADTTLIEPTGMSPRNTSTAADLVALGRLALDDPIVSTIVSTPSVTLPELGQLLNTNRLLGMDGVDGIKTGNLDGIGSNLLFSADYAVGSRSISVVGVVLGAADRDTLYSVVDTLLGSVERGFREVRLTTAGEPFATFSTPWESSARAVAAKDASVLLWLDTTITADIEVDEITSDRFGRMPDEIGSVVFTAGPSTVSVPLELDVAIEEPDPWWRLTHPFEAAEDRNTD